MDKVTEKLVAAIQYLDDKVTEGARPSKPVAEFLEALAEIEEPKKAKEPDAPPAE